MFVLLQLMTLQKRMSGHPTWCGGCVEGVCVCLCEGVCVWRVCVRRRMRYLPYLTDAKFVLFCPPPLDTHTIAILVMICA